MVAQLKHKAKHFEAVEYL